MDTESIIRTLFRAWERGERIVGPTQLSKELSIPKSTAQKILLTLANSGYGTYVAKKGLILTETGIKEGKKIIRRHRLLECMLEEFGVEKDKICTEASKMKIGEELEKILERRYKRERCPCGNIIPP